MSLKKISWRLPLLILTLILLISWLHPLSPKFTQSDSFEPLIKIDEELLDAVVQIHIIGDNPNYRNHKGCLSGFIFQDDDGRKKILTNAHLINGFKKEEIRIIFAKFRDGTKSPEELRLISYDEAIDVALLEFLNYDSGKNHPALRLGSSSKLKRLQRVISVGHPSPFTWVADMGIINCIQANNNFLQFRAQPEFIVHDCSLNLGSSGSPLLNEQSEVVGINYSIFFPQMSAGFLGLTYPANIFGGAIPIDDIKFLLPRLRIGEDIKHLPREILISYSTDLHDTELERYNIPLRPRHGLVVLSVRKDSYAKTLGLKPGDIIVACNGQKPKDLTHLLRLMYLYHDPKTPLSLKIDRYGQESEIDINQHTNPR